MVGCGSRVLGLGCSCASATDRMKIQVRMRILGVSTIVGLTGFVVRGCWFVVVGWWFSTVRDALINRLVRSPSILRLHRGRASNLTFALGAHFRRWSRRIPFAFNVACAQTGQVKTLPLF